MTRALLLALTLSVIPVAAAQTSANYKLTESTFNAGGDPNQGGFPSSAHYRVRLDAIGDAAVSSATLSSASYRMNGGFVSDYPPPGEVRSLTIDKNKQTLRWQPEPSIGSYGLYRDLLSNLTGTYGTCFQAGIVNETWNDASTPPARNGYFYLVTARNRVYEEGPKGYSSTGAQEPNLYPCP